MSSRQEEKERRRRERQELEAAEQASAARRKRLQMVFGVVLVVLLLGAGAAVAAMTLGGGDDDSPDVPVGGADIPALKEADVTKAAAAAGCKYEPKVANEGSGHEEKDFKASDYKQNPPTSGNHFPQWYEDGVYAPGNTPELGKLVHTLEHGRIDIQYKKGSTDEVRAQLETLYNEMDGGHHLLLFENGTDMPFAVAATAWDASLGCPTMNPQVFDAIRAFRKAHIDKGPEVVP